MRLALVFSIGILVLFSSCKKPKDNTPRPGPAHQLKLVKIHTEEYNKTTNEYFEYDADGYLTKVTVEYSHTPDSSHRYTDTLYTTSYIYDANHIAIRETTHSRGNVRTGNYTYANDKLQRVNYTSTNGDSSYFTTYTWNNNKVTQVTMRYATGKLRAEYKLNYDTNGNVTKMQERGLNDTVDFKDYIINTTYDSNPGYINTLKGLANIYAYLNERNIRAYSTNNITSETLVDLPSPWKFDYTIDYNSSNYPIKVKGAYRTVEYTYQ